jgi:hypothetical protein
MKKVIRICLIASSLALAACDAGPWASADAIRAQAAQSLQQRNFTEAANQAEFLTKKRPDGYDGYFMLAQARAQLDDKNAALAALEAAIKKGYKDDQAIDQNANLKPLRSMAAYAELMDAAFPKREKKPTLDMDKGASLSASAGITESDTKTVIRAGDVVIELPKEK